MSCRTILSFLEIPTDTNPNWTAAADHIQTLPFFDVETALHEAGFDYADEPLDEAESRQELQESYETARSIWEGTHRFGGTISLTQTDLLYAGGDDADSGAMETVDHLNLFVACGAAEAAGFLKRK